MSVARSTAVAVVVLVLTHSLASTTDAIRVVTTARAIQQGEVVLFTARADAPIEALRARAFDREVPTFRVDARTWQAVLGIDLDTPPHSYAVSFDGQVEGQDARATITLVVRKRLFATRSLRVDDAFVNPPRPTLERIASEAAELATTFEQATPSRRWGDAFVRPAQALATSSFGVRSIFNGAPRQPHGGTDFPGPVGTPVVAPGGGRIMVARDLYFTGNTVVIDHGLGVFSLLAHLSVLEVAVGDEVAAGQRVGQMGSTGRVTGPHLHWAVRVGSARVDPLAMLATMGVMP